MKIKYFSYLLLFIIFSSTKAHAIKIRTAYSTIHVENSQILKELNTNIYLGRLRYFMPSFVKTTEDEMAAKGD